MSIVEELRKAGYPGAQLVGSRVTCSPPPTDTDQDVLVLVQKGGFNDLARWACEDHNFKLDGSEVEDYFDLSPADTFRSLSDGEHNIIATEDPIFFRKFMAATHVAKRLNLLDKDDRIMLFQAVLYGNEV